MLGYEGMRSTKQTASTGITLTPAQRQGNFSATSAPITDPLNNQPFPGNIIPAHRLNPVSVNLASYLPLPNQPGAVNFAGVTRDDINADQALTRIDQYLGKNDQIFGHYLYSRRDYPNYDFNPVFKADRTFPNQSLAIQHVHTFSPTLLNEFRFGYQRGNQVTTPRQNTSFTPDDIGIVGLRVDGPTGRSLMGREAGFPQVDISGFVGMGDRNISTFALDFSRTFQFVDNLTIIRTNHAMKMGADVRYLLDDATTVNLPFGNLSFTSDISGNAAAAYMLGYPRTVLTPEGLPISAARQWRYAFYFQDDWKATPKLTINLGARYDLLLVPKDINGNTRTLRFDLDPAGPVLWPQQGQVAELWEQEYWHVAPRVGFAYRMRSNTVIRGGYGIFTTAHQFNNLDILQLNPPIAGSVTITNDTVNPVATINSPMPAALFPNPI
jgi:hypothetical protein